MGSNFTQRPGGLRLDAALAMIVIGACCVVLGGLAAAVTEPLDLAHGSWLAAYLVLVCGVAQYVMGLVQARQRSGADRSSSWAWAQFGGWNLGNLGVVVGTLIDRPPIVDAGSVLLVFALLIALRDTRSDSARFTGRASALTIWAFRLLLLILIVSIPIGILLSHLRSS